MATPRLFDDVSVCHPETFHTASDPRDRFDSDGRIGPTIESDFGYRETFGKEETEN